MPEDGSGFSRYTDQDIALMRMRRAQGAAYEEIAREFGCSKSVAWHHTHDVNLEQSGEVSEAESANSNSIDVLDTAVTITVPVTIKPSTLITLQAAAKMAGYDGPDEYVESILRARRLEESRTRVELETLQNQVSTQRRPSPQEHPIEVLRRAYLKGYEIRMLMQAVNGETQVVEEPPEWLFPDYYAKKREEARKRALEDLLEHVRTLREAGWTPEQMVKTLRIYGYSEDIISYVIDAR